MPTETPFWIPQCLRPVQKAALSGVISSIPANIPHKIFESVVLQGKHSERLLGGQTPPTHETDAGIIIPTRLNTQEIYTSLERPAQRGMPDVLKDLLSAEKRIGWNYNLDIQNLTIPRDLYNQIPAQFRTPKRQKHYGWVPYTTEVNPTLLEVLDYMCVPWINMTYHDAVIEAFKALINTSTNASTSRQR